MIPGKTVAHVIKMPAKTLVREFARTPETSEFAADKYVAPARTGVVKSRTAQPEIAPSLSDESHSPRQRTLTLSSDLTMYATVRVLQAEGRYSQALDIANAVLADQVARPSPDPTRPDLAASLAIIADLVHSLRCDERKQA